MTRKVNKKPTVKAKSTAKKVVNTAKQKTMPIYEKVGKLNKSVADAIKRESADICIDKSHLRHILEKHGKELTQLGLTPIMFIDMVMAHYNRIYKAREEALFLVLYGRLPKVIVIEMVIEMGFYKIKTATVMSKIFLKRQKLLWKKK